MRMPGFSAEMAICNLQRRFRVRPAGLSAARDSISPALMNVGGDVWCEDDGTDCVDYGGGVGVPVGGGTPRADCFQRCIEICAFDETLKTVKQKQACERRCRRTCYG